MKSIEIKKTHYESELCFYCPKCDTWFYVKALIVNYEDIKTPYSQNVNYCYWCGEKLEEENDSL
jgi:hypothetical protein